MIDLIKQKDYFDLGLVTYHQKLHPTDYGADTAFFTGHYAFWQRDKNTAVDIEDHLIINGKIIRHYKKGTWWSELDRASRDQTIPVLVSLGYFNRPSLWSIFKDHLTRGLLFTTNTKANRTNKSKNPDFTGPEVWGIYSRSSKFLWPLVWVFDLMLLFNTLTWLIFKPEPNQHAILLEYARRRHDTIWAFISRFILKRSNSFTKAIKGYWFDKNFIKNGVNIRPYFIGNKIIKTINNYWV